MQQICLLCNGMYIDSCFLGFQCYPTLQNLKSSSIIILSSKSIQPPSIVKGGKAVGHFHVNVARQTHYSERVNMQDVCLVRLIIHLQRHHVFLVV